SSCLIFFLPTLQPPPIYSLFPYTTLFRSSLDFADKRFTPNGELFLNPFDLEGFLGDKFTVNGAIQPFLKVARRKYRFRLLNAGRSEEHTSELQSRGQLVCRLLLEKKTYDE